ncbi:MAG: PDZ domain-containing protein [Vicinamibacterales bacterium]
MLGLAASTPAALHAQPPEPVRYTLRFPAPHTHYVEVEARVPTDGRPRVELMMPIWTPGSYLAREYARHVESVAARSADGRPLAVRKSRKNRWTVDTAGVPTFVLTYRVYGREMTVRNNWIERDLAILNGAPTFITLASDRRRPHDVTVLVPRDWPTVVTPLDDARDGAPHHYVAPDYDTLVDSPIVAGSPRVDVFEVSGKRHYLVTEGAEGMFDADRAVRDVERIVRAAERLWGSLPYDRYVFFNMLTGPGGGLEHKASTLMMSDRWQTGTRAGYLGWLSLVSHEYFHAWNVKRLRPVELGPFDYENEVYTTSLWEAEGFTDYYADLVIRRAGLSSDDELLAAVGDQIRQLQTTPGRQLQSAADASYDAWIKQYRPDENSPNTSISYYVKGAVLAFVLDARIRTSTNGARTLDDGLRLAYQRFSGERGYTREELARTMSEVADADLGPWFATAVDSTREIDYDETLKWLGLRFKTAPDAPAAAWLGLTTRVDAGRLLVSQVVRGTPAHDAGFNVDDELLAIGELRVTAEQWPARLRHYRPGQTVSVLVARRDKLTRLEVTLAVEPGTTWSLEIAPDATDAQKARLRAWMTGS